MSIEVPFKTRYSSIRHIVQLMTPLDKRDPEFIDSAACIIKATVPKRDFKNWNLIYSACPMCQEKVEHVGNAGNLAAELEWALARHMQVHSVEEMKAAIIERSLEQS